MTSSPLSFLAQSARHPLRAAQAANSDLFELQATAVLAQAWRER
jgi:hypothetical protein